jgi:hypothetical protein
VALWQAKLVAYREEAVGDCGWGRELVGFDVEGGGVAFADFEVPVYRGSVSTAEQGIVWGTWQSWLDRSVYVLVLPNPPP